MSCFLGSSGSNQIQQNSTELNIDRMRADSNECCNGFLRKESIDGNFCVSESEMERELMTGRQGWVGTWDFSEKFLDFLENCCQLSPQLRFKNITSSHNIHFTKKLNEQKVNSQ